LAEAATPVTPAPSSATKWWQWAFVYPALATSLFAAVPRVWEEYKALRLGVARSQIQLVQEQQRLWEANLECISQQGIYEADGPEGLIIRVTLCPSGAVLLRYYDNEWPAVYRWVARPARKGPDHATLDTPPAAPAGRLRAAP
jgi:hypothetical protein